MANTFAKTRKDENHNEAKVINSFIIHSRFDYAFGRPRGLYLP